MEITDKTIEALLRALDLSVEGITVHHSFYRKDAREAAATIRALRAELAQARAAAIEEAAKVADFGGIREQGNHEIAAAIRALTSEPRSAPHREAS